MHWIMTILTRMNSSLHDLSFPSFLCIFIPHLNHSLSRWCSDQTQDSVQVNLKLTTHAQWPHTVKADEGETAFISVNVHMKSAYLM